MKKCKSNSYLVTLLLVLFLLTGIAWGDGCNKHGAGQWVFWDVNNTSGEEFNVTVFSYRVSKSIVPWEYNTMLGNGDDYGAGIVHNNNSPYALCGAALYADGANRWDVKICRTSGGKECFRVIKECDIASSDWAVNFTGRIFKLNISAEDGMYKLEVAPPKSGHCEKKTFDAI